MAVDLSAVASDCVMELNAGAGYSTTVTDPRWADQQIIDAVLNADGLVVAACISDVNNPYASLFYSTVSGIANGGHITPSLGPIVAIEFVVTGGEQPVYRAGKPWDSAEISYEIRNVDTLRFDPHFSLQGRVLYHNGISIAFYESCTVSVNCVVINFTASGACQAPDVFGFLVFCGAMAQLVNVEGENDQAQSIWGQLFYEGLKLIREGKSLPPGFEESARAKSAEA